jgi:hypothetical protein
MNFHPLLTSKSKFSFKILSGLRTNKIMGMGPDGPETKNYCAGEGQKQITAVL